MLLSDHNRVSQNRKELWSLSCLGNNSVLVHTSLELRINTFLVRPPQQDNTVLRGQRSGYAFSLLTILRDKPRVCNEHLPILTTYKTAQKYQGHLSHLVLLFNSSASLPLKTWNLDILDEYITSTNCASVEDIPQAHHLFLLTSSSCLLSFETPFQ